MDQDIKTIIQYPVGATEFDIPFDYLSRKFVRVSLVSDDNRRLLSNITEYRYVSKTRVKLLVATDGFDRVEIRRFTSASERIVDFSDGSVLRAADLNVSQLQSAHIAEEARDVSLMSMLQDDAGNLDAKGRRIVNLGEPVDRSDAATKGYVNDSHAKSLRFETDNVQALPPLANMDGKILGFVDGKPVGILPDSGSAADVMLELARPEGWNLVGYVETFDKLKDVSGLVVGQRVRLKRYQEGTQLGGGEFEAVAGSAVSDGGHIVSLTSTNTMHLRRVASKVELQHYGIYIEGNASGPRVDQSAKLQAAFNRARADKKVLSTGIASENHYIYNGVYIENGVDITGVKTIEGCLSLLLDSTKFSGKVAPGYPDIEWALVNLNAKFDSGGIIFGTTVGNQTFDSIVVRDVSNRGASCGGQLHTTSGTMVSGALCATGFDGPGVWVLGSYDSVISDIRAVHSGNVAQWAVSLAGYRGTVRADNTNCMDIGRIECHDSVDRALNCSADLSTIGEVHIEATLVTSSEQSTSATIADNGWGYANVLLAGLGTQYGSIRDLPVVGSIPAVLEAVANDTHIGQVSMPRSNLALHFAFTTPRGVVSAGDVTLNGNVIVTDGASVQFNSLTLLGASNSVKSSSTSFNVSLLRATGASAFIELLGGTIDRISVTKATIDGTDIQRGSVGTLIVGDRNTVSQTTIGTLTVNGTRNQLAKGTRVSGTSTLSGLVNSARDVVFVGEVTLKDPWKFTDVYMNSNLVYTGATSSTKYGASFKDVYIEGDLILSGTCRIHGYNLRAINMRIGVMNTGFILLTNCVLSGGVEGNYIGSFNVPQIGSTTQNFTTGALSVFTTSGWKSVTVA